MSVNVPSEFVVTVRPIVPGDAAVQQDMNDSVLGLRARLEYAHENLKRLERSQQQQREAWLVQERQLISDAINIVDSFEQVFRMFNEQRTGAEQKALLVAFQTTFDLLLRSMENWGIHCVDVRGKSYQEVQFRGKRIQDPWEVVDAGPLSKAGPKVAREVLRSLWVRTVDEKVQLLRRAQVTC